MFRGVRTCPRKVLKDLEGFRRPDQCFTAAVLWVSLRKVLYSCLTLTPASKFSLIHYKMRDVAYCFCVRGKTEGPWSIDHVEDQWKVAIQEE